MVSILSLWLPILLSAVLVWIVSALVWTVMPHHKSDFKKVPDEDSARNALTPQKIPPGQYNIPHVVNWDDAKKPEVIQKFDDGPVAYMTVVPNGMPSMGKNMVMSFIFYLVVGAIVAYVATRTMGANTEYLQVFRVTGVVAWLTYGFGVIPEAIWFGRPWSSIIKNLLDALAYALLTAGCFGWLWPN